MPEAHRTTCRVIYADTDTMGIAYHANYFRWFEIGRTEMFRDLGMAYREMESQGIFMPVAEAYCRFIQPVRYDELLVIETTLDRRVRAGLKFDYVVYKPDGSTRAATGFTKHPCTDVSGKVVRPPAFLRSFLEW